MTTLKSINLFAPCLGHEFLWLASERTRTGRARPANLEAATLGTLYESPIEQGLLPFRVQAKRELARQFDYDSE
jgi:hypothetical protein